MAHQCHAPQAKRQRRDEDGRTDTPEVYARAYEERPVEERLLPDADTEAGNLLGLRCENIRGRIQLNPTDVETLRHIYPPQEEIAAQVTRVIRDEPKVLFQIVCALTQSGKTGAMVSITEKALKTHCIDPDCIYTITGVNAKEWKQQTKHRQLSPFQKRVLHRGELYPPRETNTRRRTKAGKKRRRTMKRFGQLRNALLIIDEAHVAAAEGMTLDKLLDIICAKNLTELCQRNINIVLFTATPNLLQQEVQTQQWSCGAPSYRMHIMRQGDGYTSIFDLLDTGRVSEYENLAGEDSGDSDDENDADTGADEDKGSTPVERLKTFIYERYNTPRIHIIRTPYQEKQATVVDRVRGAFGEQCKYHVLDSETSGSSNSSGGVYKECMRILNTRPKKHTFIFIKEGLRCAVTLPHKERIGVLYERKRKNGHPFDDVIVQGLLGRGTGYDVDPHTHIFTHIESIVRYKDFVDSGYREYGSFRFPHSNPRSETTVKNTNIHKKSWRT